MAGNLNELTETQFKMVLLEEKYAHLQCEAEQYREEARLARCQVDILEDALDKAKEEVEMMRVENASIRDEADGLERLKERSALVISGLQNSNRETQKKVAQLEAKFRSMRDTIESSEERQQTHETDDIKYQIRSLASRLGITNDMASEMDVVFAEANDQLDRAALKNARLHETEAVCKELREQLSDVRSKSADLTSRFEALLLEKETFRKQTASLSIEKLDFSAVRQLLNQRVDAQEKQIADLKEQLTDANKREAISSSEIQQLVFERNSNAIQFKALLESLAASLSSVDRPCTASEAGVKETVSHLSSKLQHFKDAGGDLDSKVGELQRQFEHQFKISLSTAEELKTTKRRVEELSCEKQKLQMEVDGYRLIGEGGKCNSTSQITNDLLALCEDMGIPNQRTDILITQLVHGLRSKVADLIADGCISQECLTSRSRAPVDIPPIEGLISNSRQMKGTGDGCPESHNLSHHHHHHPRSGSPNSKLDRSPRGTICRTSCPGCELLQTSAVDLARHAPDWSAGQERRVKELCACCLHCLAMALRSRLGAALADLEEQLVARQQSTVEANEENREKQLIQELFDAREQIEALHETITKLETERSAELEQLERMAAKLEGVRKQQARKIAGLQTRTEAQKASEVVRTSQLNAAKDILAGSRQKQLRLMDFRNSLARLLNVDTWITPNPETIMFQRVQALLCSAQMLSARQPISGWSQPMTTFPAPIVPGSNFPALAYTSPPPMGDMNGIEQSLHVTDVTSPVQPRRATNRSEQVLRKSPSCVDMPTRSKTGHFPARNTISSRRNPIPTVTPSGAPLRAKSASAKERDSRKY